MFYLNLILINILMILLNHFYNKLSNYNFLNFKYDSGRVNYNTGKHH